MNEVRLIDANALIDKLPRVDLDQDERITKSGAVADMVCLISSASTIEAEPVQHSRWIDMGDFESCSLCQCTRLKEIETYYGKATRLWVKTNYCPNCGAKMDLG